MKLDKGDGIWNEILQKLVDKSCTPVYCHQIPCRAPKQRKNRLVFSRLLSYLSCGTISVCIHLKEKEELEPHNLEAFVTFNIFAVVHFGNIGETEFQTEETKCNVNLNLNHWEI